MSKRLRYAIPMALLTIGSPVPGDSWAWAQKAKGPTSHGSIAPDDAARYLGRYAQQNISGDIRVVHRNGFLTALIPGRPPIRMLADGEHTFKPEHLEDVKIVFQVSGDRATGYTFVEPDRRNSAKWVGELPQAGDLSCEAVTLSGPQGISVDALRCRLLVPENRGKPDSNLIELAFARLISKSKQPKSPLIYLHGGPGGRAANQVRSPQRLTEWLPYLEFTDVILLDQRGCGFSSPRLQWTPEDTPVDLFKDEATARKFMLDACQRAADHFRDRGVDLSGYTTVENADDLNDIRKALGADKMSLLGFSYGTHLAQAAIRRHGQYIENVVMCGVEGLDMTFKYPLNMDTQFEKLSLLAHRDSGLQSHIPDLRKLLERVLKKLKRRPMIVETTDPETGKAVKVPVGKFGLQLLLRFDMGDASDLVVFPRLLYSIDNGDSSVLQWFVEKRFAMFRQVNLLTWVMDGASGASPSRLDRIRAEAKQSLFGNVMNFPYPQVSRIFGNLDLGGEFRAPLVSDVRTMFLSGSLDWNTPPYQAERVRWGFTNSVHVVVENAGHEQILSHPDIQSAVRRFLQGEEVRDVNVTLPPLQFVPVKGADSSVTHPSVSQ